jgi:hypothetical protein
LQQALDDECIDRLPNGHPRYAEPVAEISLTGDRIAWP